MKINQFTKQNMFLSNFYICQNGIMYEGIIYPSTEHAFQASKSLDYQDRIRIASCQSPATAKKLGRNVKIRNNWDNIKLKIMEDLLKIKFSEPYLKGKLISTNPKELEEGNYWHDNYWGVCYCENCHGIGENNLGKLLMKLRTLFLNK